MVTTRLHHLNLMQNIDNDTSIAMQPIAIVGMAVNFPDAPDSDAFWKLLEDGLNTVSKVWGIVSCNEGVRTHSCCRSLRSVSISLCIPRIPSILAGR